VPPEPVWLLRLETSLKCVQPWPSVFFCFGVSGIPSFTSLAHQAAPAFFVTLGKRNPPRGPSWPRRRAASGAQSRGAWQIGDHIGGGPGVHSVLPALAASWRLLASRVAPTTGRPNRLQTPCGTRCCGPTIPGPSLRSLFAPIAQRGAPLFAVVLGVSNQLCILIGQDLRGEPDILHGQAPEHAPLAIPQRFAVRPRCHKATRLGR
jgi:hypothetical protein